MPRVNVHKGTIPKPNTSSFSLVGGEGSFPDGISTGGAPWVDVMVNIIGGVDKFRLMVWADSSTDWEVFQGELFTVDYSTQPFRIRTRREVGSAVRFVAIAAADIQLNENVPVPGSSFDGDDDAEVSVDASYG